nr:MAG TPA: hypothetical protein [Crassvirales sp.]
MAFISSYCLYAISSLASCASYFSSSALAFSLP